MSGDIRICCFEHTVDIQMTEVPWSMSDVYGHRDIDDTLVASTKASQYREHRPFNASLFQATC